MKSDDRRVLTAKEAAKYLGVSLATLRKIEAEGALLPSRTPGGHRRYSREMLENYFEKSRKTERDGTGELRVHEDHPSEAEVER